MIIVKITLEEQINKCNTFPNYAVDKCKEAGIPIAIDKNGYVIVQKGKIDWFEDATNYDMYYRWGDTK